jgi:hypothetical protein
MAALINNTQVGLDSTYNYNSVINDKTISLNEAPMTIESVNEQSRTSDNLTFWDFLDIINPLQHIPGISSLYRAVTGDEIGSVAKIAGSTLYGGPLGAASSLIDVAVDASTGRDIGEHALNVFNLVPINNIKQTIQEPPIVALAFNAVDSNPYLVKTAILAQEIAVYPNAKNGKFA